MKKYIICDLSNLVLGDQSWNVFNETENKTEDFFLLFNYFKPIDKILNLPLSAENLKTNAIFVHKGIRLILNLDFGKDNIVKKIRFDKNKTFFEPFAVYVKSVESVKIGDSFDDILQEIIKQKHVVKKV